MRPRTVLCLILAGTAVVAASPAGAQVQRAQISSMQDVATESPVFWGRVATFFGLEPAVIQGLVPEFRRDGVNTRDAVLLVIFAHKRTLRLLRGGQITKDQVGQRFRGDIHDLLSTRRARANWKTLLADQGGVDLNEMVKQAANSVREAVSPPSDPKRAMAIARAATPKEIPEDLYEPLLQRLRTRPETLKLAWGALEPITQKSPRAAVILLVLAKEKSDRLLEYRVAPAREGEKDQLFLGALAEFMAQIESRPRVGWGALASQVGVTSHDLEREAAAIIIAALERQQQRERPGAAHEAAVVPAALSEW